MPVSDPSALIRDLKIIDCDTHWCEPADLWTSRAPAKFKDRVPHQERVEGKGIHWFIEGDQDFGYGLLSVVDKQGGKHKGFSLNSFDDIHPGGYDVKARLKYMDETGIWAHIIYPNSAGFSATRFMGAFKDKELQRLCIQLYNDAIADLQRESGGRLLPQALLPITSMDDCVQEMRRCIEDLKLTGFAISDNLTTLGVPEYADPFWEPFFEYANSTGIPLDFHIGGSVIDTMIPVWNLYKREKPVDETFDVSGEVLALASSYAGMGNAPIIGNFLYSGMYDKYPNLKMVSVESGIGWIPWYLESLEYQYDEMIQPHMRRMQRRPREYWNDHWSALFWFETSAPRKLIAEVGVKNVLFETDYPHPTCLYPGVPAVVEGLVADWDEYTARRVLQDNAAKLYKIPLDVPARR